MHPTKRKGVFAVKNTQANSYINDTESGAEMARLIDQSRTVTKCTGGLLAEQSNVERFRRALDIGCGPGGWVLELAFAYPDLEVIGIDISTAMITYAKARARVQQLTNAAFEVMDATQPLAFEEASFDLVNIRTIAGFMRTHDWSPLMQECGRVLRPGGILRITETDHWGITNSPAFAELIDLVYRAVFYQGHSFDPSRRTYGITPMLERLVAEAGCNREGIGTQAHAVNFSIGAPAYESMLNNFFMFFKLIQPYLLKTREEYPSAGIPPQDELERLYNQTMVEMTEADFIGIIYFLTAWGEKP